MKSPSIHINQFYFLAQTSKQREKVHISRYSASSMEIQFIKSIFIPVDFKGWKISSFLSIFCGSDTFSRSLSWRADFARIPQIDKCNFEHVVFKRISNFFPSPSHDLHPSLDTIFHRYITSNLEIFIWLIDVRLSST